MAEGNGTGRLDRIEALLEIVGERLNKLGERQSAFQVTQERDHDEFARDHKQLMTWQVLMQDKMEKFDAERAVERKRLDTLWENTDKRIADLVGAIEKR